MTRAIAVLGAALAATLAAAPAWSQVKTINARSGQPVMVHQTHVCNAVMPKPSASAEHGTAEVVAITVVSCGRNDQPAWRVVYTSNPGFKGLDTVNVIPSRGRGQVVNVNVR